MVNGVLNAFAYIAKWLREMSLAGGAQNVFAICMFCLIGCMPLAGFIVLCIRNRKIDKLDMLYNGLLSTMPNRNLSSEINLDDLGMILIRPETFGAKEKYKDFLKSLKLELLLEKDF